MNAQHSNVRRSDPSSDNYNQYVQQQQYPQDLYRTSQLTGMLN